MPYTKEKLEAIREHHEMAVSVLNAFLEQLPENLRDPNNAEKQCLNCYNRGYTLQTIGFYWAERRCHYCNDFDSWSHIANLRDEITEKITEEGEENVNDRT